MSAGRLSTFAAALVIARRDFVAVIFSRSFIFFLLAPLFPVIIAIMAGGIGQRVQQSTEAPQLGIAMQAQDIDALTLARQRLDSRIGALLPDFVVVKSLAAGETFDPQAALRHGNFSAIATGSTAHVVLTGPPERIAFWRGPISMVAAEARQPVTQADTKVTLINAASVTRADQRGERMRTAQSAQTVMFFLTMMLAGMVLSNLVEEKGNKIIEILAAAIPMDAVFFGKLFAMLAVSLVGICAWGLAGGAILVAGAHSLGAVTEPAVGWPMFIALGVIYYAMGYLLIGSIFLAIGSMATTVREVQTLSLPATMLELFVFLYASYAMTQPGTPTEIAAIVIPFSSPYAMLARAAQDGVLWPHVLAIAWQALCVVVLVRLGARLFRTKVMKSGTAGGPRRGLFSRRKAASV